MRYIKKIVILPIASCCLFSSVCLSACGNTSIAQPISIDDIQKKQDTSTNNANFIFNIEESYFNDGISAEIVDSSSTLLEIEKIEVKNSKLNLSIFIKKLPSFSSTYTFAINFVHPINKTKWKINNLTINYIFAPIPGEPFIFSPNQTSVTTNLINPITGGIELRFEHFTYNNIPLINNIVVTSTFDYPSANFDYYIDKQSGNSFDIVIKSNNLKDSTILSGHFNFYLNSSLIKSDDKEFEIKVLDYKKVVPNDSYSYSYYAVSGERYCDIKGLKSSAVDYNFLDIPSDTTYDGYKYKVRGIEDGAFESLNETFPNIIFLSFSNSINLERIGNNAFKNSILLTGNLAFPNSLKTIGHSCFENCKKIGSTLTLNPNIESIGESAFAECSLINQIDLSSIGGFPSWCSKIYDESSEEFVANNIFRNLSYDGNVDVFDNIDGWKNILNENCSLYQNWTINII